MVQNDKKFCSSHFISQEPYIIWLSFRVHICKMIISSGVFFNFKILIFRVVRGLKGQKMAQNDKKFCLSHSVSQELYITGLWFLVNMCKMMISPANFFVFQNFDFWGFYGGKRAIYISGTVDHIIKILIMISTSVFLSLFFFLIQHCKH